MERKYSLEQSALEFAEANATPPFIYQLPPEEGRNLLDTVQNSEVFKHPCFIKDTEVDTGKWGAINVRTIIPEDHEGTLDVIFYIHGAGWVFGDAHTHDKLVRELAARTGSVVVFPEYSRSPEAQYPTAIEQSYAVLNMLPEWAEQNNWNLDCLTVAGDSVGGNMATVMCIMAKQRGGINIHKQLLYYPVTDHNFETGSYNEFATDYFLTKEGMQWFWDQYTTDEGQRNEITASPLRATTEELQGLPDAIILNGQCDVLRDEGEAYAIKLREAGVDVTAVRFQAMVHDFVMVNSLDKSNACRAAMDLSIKWIKRKNHHTRK